MNAHEAANRLYVPGMPNPVPGNRYYICSEILRERGWTGAGDVWLSPEQPNREYDDTWTFETALALSGVGRWYELRATHERVSDCLEQMREPVLRMMDKFRMFRQRLAASPEWQRLREMLSEPEEVYTSYESAWIEWAEDAESGQMEKGGV